MRDTRDRNVIVRFARTGQRIPAQGTNPRNRIREKKCVLMAPVSTLGPGALTSSSASTKPLLRIRSHAKMTFGEAFGEAFGAATGVSAPSYNEKSASETTNHAAKPPL